VSSNSWTLRSARERDEGATTASIDTKVFQSPTVAVGAFRCPSWHPLFRDSGPIENHIFVFPRRAVRLCHEGRQPFVADPGVVTLYNRAQRYWRSALAPADECEWFAVEQRVLIDAVRAFDPAVDERPERPFKFELGPGDPRVYLEQRRLFVSLQRATRPPDLLRVEETVISLLDAVLERAYAFWTGTHGSPRPTRGQREMVEHAKALLAERLADPVGLAYFAREVGTSVFHLCRAFRAATGSPLHAYRNRLRLHQSLERLAEGEALIDVALDLGYSSHSHFTAAFRRAFGVTPSALRRSLGLPRLTRDAGKILTAETLPGEL
jgi:AraC-like DNA-binding protein